MVSDLPMSVNLIAKEWDSFFQQEIYEIFQCSLLIRMQFSEGDNWKTVTLKKWDVYSIFYVILYRKYKLLTKQ